VADWISAEAARVFPKMLARLDPLFTDHERRRNTFAERLEPEFERIFRLMHQLYGWQWNFAYQLEAFLTVIAAAWDDRPKWLRQRDEQPVTWTNDPATTWAMTYVERFTGTIPRLLDRAPHLRSLGITHLHLMPPYAVPDGPNDGGYAVSSYRATRPDLGTMAELVSVIRALDAAGISVVLDFVANHTAEDHPWAEAAKRGEPPYDRYYFLFDERSQVEPWAPYLREIFPDRGGDAFTWRSDVAGPNGGKWVWTTFYPFQWDLDYSNPEVLVAMTGELLHIANLGPSVVRMDATPFLWKRPGTSCENLPEAHTLLQLMNAAASIAAPSVRFLSEAIVHPDDVTRFVRADECALGYNPLVMASTWEAVATRRTTLLADALSRRARLPEGCQWLTYLRSHDDIGWGFADEDALRLGIDPVGHRRFLNSFFSGEFDLSFAAGARFQDNPRTGDARISGTTASLAGLELALAAADLPSTDLAVARVIAMETIAFTSVGIPMIYLGDEIGICNHYRYADEPEHAGDNRWMHRPPYDWGALADAEADPASPAGRILRAIRGLVEFRAGHPSLGNGAPHVMPTGDPAVIAFTRRSRSDRVLVVVNLADRAAEVSLDLGQEKWKDIGGDRVPTTLTLAPYQTILAGG
jgi:amylosucrase